MARMMTPRGVSRTLLMTRRSDEMPRYCARAFPRSSLALASPVGPYT